MKILDYYSTKDLLYISIFAALGLAIKPIISPLINSLASWIPGGAIAGGIYMIWLVLTMAVVDKTGAGILFGITQGLLVLILGWFGNHGIISLATYTLPALVPEIIRLLYKNKDQIFYHIVLCSTANLAGTLLVTILIMRLPLIPLLISLVFSIISGAVGGIISYRIYNLLLSYRLVSPKN
ncbi:MAG: ECF transporter S component [Candidatus Cloacimonetes bacterium]|nr:ECF transporter S component [Candidatus Cloacimonadota bacterium]MBS3768241.1 ECF transporter S component [Candidatus Cloacimonadota bacterium]